MLYLRTAAGIIAGFLLCVAALVGSLCLGSVALPLREVIGALLLRLAGPETCALVTGSASIDPVALAIVWELRLARTLLAGVAGAALGVSGAVLQGLFRNPLADPYALGVSSGASLGAVIAIAFAIVSPVGFVGSIELFAFAGALGAAVLVYGVAASHGIGMAKGRRRMPATVSLLLAGTAVSLFLSAFVSLLVTRNDRDLHTVFFWLLGGFGGKSWPNLATALPPALVSIALALVLVRPLDILGAGEEAASSLGLDVKKARKIAVISSSLGAAAAVSAGGVIGFVGLLGPHLARQVVGPGHRRLIPASAAAGGILLMLADALSRSVAAPLELPVGIITSLLGAPLFIWLLIRGQEGGSL